MSNQDQLSVVVTAFEQWRKNRTSPKGATPQPLRQQAVALKSQYSSSRITIALKISGGQFKQWCKDYQSLNESIDFVQLPVTSSPQIDEVEEGALKLELSFSHGEQLRLSGQITPILIAIAPTDFRAGIDGFVVVCRRQLKQNPSSGTLFVFINRNKTMIRALTYDGTGFWLMTKRLSKGKFTGWPKSSDPISKIAAIELKQMLSGHDRSRFSKINEK